MLSVSANIEYPAESPLDQSNDWPELATNDHWRANMRRARNDAGLTQGQLGLKVGVSQNVISRIESGEQRASAAVMPICHALKILPPVIMITDDLEQRWHDAGRQLRARDPAFYEAQVEAMEQLARSLAEKRSQ